MAGIEYFLVAGLIIGFIFGFILQSGRFCMNSAFRDIILLKEFKLAKAVAVSLAVLAVGFAIFAFAGLINLSPRDFKPWAAIVGGLVFGVGMVLAGGCASGTTYRVGEGMMGSFVAAIGLTVGALMTAVGVLKDLKDALHIANFGKITLVGVYDPLSIILPIFMLIFGIIGIALMFFFWAWPALKNRGEKPLVKFDNVVEQTFKKSFPWWVTGILIGLILTAGYIATGTGPVGITGGWKNISDWLTAGDFILGGGLTWPGFIIFGILAGALVSAILKKEFKFRVPKDGFTLFKQFCGGILMGFGAVTAMGCNITNILGGIPQLSVHSIIVGVCIMLGSWIAAYLLFMWRKD
jgi:hypothetical protein